MVYKNRPDLVWWGTYSVPLNTVGRWSIGPSTFWIERMSNEWKIIYETGDNELDTFLDVSLPFTQSVETVPKAVITRFGVTDTDETIMLTPALADRPVVIHSETPFYVLPNQNISFYVSSPVWIIIKTGNPPVKIIDMPVFRPSDTWFGPSTMEGELCYASKSYGRLKLEDIQFRPHRAVTVVLLKNQTNQSILLKSLNLPVRTLSLYESEDGYLWTQPVTLEMKRDSDSADLEIKPRAPKEAKKPKIICEPREKIGGNILTQALYRLIK
ncbi:MAG: hypothetical protein JXB48_09595 [Candidatus Latescibacteria bacterium]|nr:hypothetical protein [Candidatus Latescibacterota bacterium]